MLAYSKPKHPIAFIILALILEITIIVFYGIFGNITMNDSNLWNQSTSPSSTNFYYFFLMNLNNIFFALILLAGFGLVMVYIKHTAWNALGFSLLITCICIQLYPLISTFWNNVFVNGWGTGNVVIDPSVSMNGSIRVAISMLVVLATLIGRIGLLDTLIVGVVGTIVYSLNIALNVSVAKSRSADANINDVGGAMDIFLFGGVLAVVIGRFLRTMNTLIHPKFSSGPGNQHPVLAFIGTIFIWSGFSYLSINSPETQYFMDLGVMNSYLCLASCVVTICAMSSIIHLRIGILEIIFGTISGGVVIGSCSMIIVNPAISILLGIIAGSLTYVYLHFLHKWVNRDGVVDSTGVIGVYIVNGVISPVFSAILIACYSTYPTWKPLFLGVTIGVDGGISNATFQLIHLGITAGVAILAGIMLGWVLKWIGSKEEIFELFEDSVEFSNYQLTTMPTMIFPPPILSSRVGNPIQENSSARLFGQNITAMINNHQPQLPPLSPIKYIPQNISRPMTPPLQSRPVTPGRPITPVRNLSPIQNLNQPVNLNPIQTRSILYNENIPQVIPQSFPHFTPQHAPQHIPQTTPVSVQSRVVPFQPITTVPPPPSMYNPQPTHTNIFTLPPLHTPSNISNRY